MKEQFARSALLLTSEKIDRLSKMHIAVFGIGGVGGFVVEALARTGIGCFTLVDHDIVSITNINRQIIATMDTIGRKKIEVMKERIHSIAPEAEVNTYDLFFLPENADSFDFSSFDYIVDAVDTVSAKIALVMKAKAMNIPIISAMGAGNKLDPTQMEVADIYHTSVCPLAKVMRHELRKRGIDSLKVVYSKETPISVAMEKDKRTPGSVAYVPSVMGLMMASEIIRDLIAEKGD